MTAWWEGPLIGFDLETTSADPNAARIVSACIVRVQAGFEPLPYTWLVNPGIEIPEGASAVHGITTEMVQSAVDAVQGVGEILGYLREFLPAVPVVAFNAQYDFTVLDREARRHGLEPLAPRPVVDPYVLDKQADRYRRGKRQLADIARLYGVPLDNAHDATADALAAARVVQRLGALAAFPPVEELHDRQVVWKLEQQTSLEGYFRMQGTLTSPVEKDWPVVPGDPA